MAASISVASSGSNASSASNCSTQSPVAFSITEFFCAAKPFQVSIKIFAQKERAISNVRSVEPESTTMISPCPSRTSGCTLSSVRGRLASSLRVMSATEIFTHREYTAGSHCADSAESMLHSSLAQPEANSSSLHAQLDWQSQSNCSVGMTVLINSRGDV